MSKLFEGSYFNGDISIWNVNEVTSLLFIFNKSQFKGYIGNWSLNKNIKRIALPLSTFDYEHPKALLSLVIAVELTRNTLFLHLSFTFSENGNNFLKLFQQVLLHRLTWFVKQLLVVP